METSRSETLKPEVGKSLAGVVVKGTWGLAWGFGANLPWITSSKAFVG